MVNGVNKETPQSCTLVERMETVFREVLSNGMDQKFKREYYFNRYAKFLPFKVGDVCGSG